ncbi:ribosomal protein S18-alanine N-acetyltransferase [Henriciella sp. AS95]|uniref:ribosomal protein S18-alanine N-acetyltransferase n=1 Tax=Henriciella sp. AS95 TaxID=3135782 RepID=UPI003179885F
MSDTPVRLLTPEDAAACARIQEEAFTHGDNWSAWAFRDTLNLSTTLGLCTEDEDVMTGFILLQKTPPDAEILTLAISPEVQRRGYASLLLERAVQLLGQYGTDRLLLDVAADNESAVAFYEKHGFLADGRRKNYYNRAEGRSVDALLMSRAAAGHNH